LSGRRLRLLFLLVCITGSALTVAPPALAASPSNDNFSAAEVISGASGWLWSSNVEATEEPGEPDNADISAPIHSVWFAWTAPSNGSFFFHTCESDTENMDTTMGAYTGSAVNALTSLAENDDACSYSGRSSHIDFGVTSGTTYYISVDGWEDTQGEFLLTWGRSNDDFAGASVISGVIGSVEGTNEGFSGETGEPDNAGNSAPIQSAWYAWTAPRSGKAVFDTCTTFDGDTTLGVYSGSAVNALTSHGDSDDDCIRIPDADDGSRVVLDVEAGVTYYISVDGFNVLTGPFTLRWQLMNDDFADAHVLSGTSGSVDGRNEYFTDEVGEPDNAGVSDPVESAWFFWTAPENGNFAFDTCKTLSGLETTLGVYTGSAVNALSSVGENNDAACGRNTYLSRVAFSATAGTTYRISVDGLDVDEGEFTLSWDYAPPVADLSIEVTDSPDPVEFGSNVKYTIVVGNDGPDPATGVDFHFGPNSNLDFVSGTTSQGSCEWPSAGNTGSVECVFGTIENGSAVTVEVTMTPDSLGKTGALVEVGSNEADPDVDDRSVREDTFVYVHPLADISVSITDAPDPVSVGSNVKYTITTSNAGPDAVEVDISHVFDDDWADKAKLVSSTTSHGSCSPGVNGPYVDCEFGSLPSGATATVTVTVKTLRSGTLRNEVSVSRSGGLDPDDEDRSATEMTTVKPKNLLRNGDFEVDGNGDRRPDNWTSNAKFTRQKTLVLSRRWAGRHQGSNDANYTIQQTVQVTQMTNYLFSGGVNIPPTSDSFEFSIQVQWRNSANKAIGFEQVELFTGPTTGWETASLDDLPAPRGAVKAQVRMIVKNLNATIHVDQFLLSR
jgi:uncharacterized repeat protein (TIGR01451 family)